MRHWLVLLMPLLVMGCDAAQVDACRPGPDVICDIVRPEDIELLPGTSTFLVSELGASEKPGRILLIDYITKTRRVIAEGRPAVDGDSSFPKCGAPPESLRPRGFHLSADQNGILHLLVVAGTRIERYHLAGAGDDLTLLWEGCVGIPAHISANDVAGFPNGDLVVSHMYDPPRNIWLNAKFLLGLNTGFAAKWSALSGWAKIPNTDVSFANGIQVDPKTSRVYVSSMFTQRIIAVDPDGGNRVESAHLATQTDNLSWSVDGRLIGAGHTGVPVYGISTCREIGEAPCSFPFAVVALDPRTLESDTLMATKTGQIPGASVAVLTDGALFLGTAYGDRITRVSLNK